MDDETGLMKPLDSAAVRSALKAVFALAMVHGALALATFAWLPERVPVHFNAAGEPDGFAGAGIGSWFTLWFVSVGLGAGMSWISLRIDRFPARYVNLPRKEEFLSLPARARSRVMASVSFHILVMTGLIMAFMFCLHVAIALHIHGALGRLPVTLIAAGIALPLLYTAVMMARVSTAISREIDAHVDGKTA